jgi:hypothetical protein
MSSTLQDFFANDSLFGLHLRHRRTAPARRFARRLTQKNPGPIGPHPWIRENVPHDKTKKR